MSLPSETSQEDYLPTHTEHAVCIYYQYGADLYWVPAEESPHPKVAHKFVALSKSDALHYMHELGQSNKLRPGHEERYSSAENALNYIRLNSSISHDPNYAIPAILR